MAMFKKPLWVLFGTGFAAFMVGVDYSIVNATLPTIQSSLHITIGQLQWLMAGFGIAFCSLLVALGRLADIMGRRKILYIGLIGFALSSLLAGCSNVALHLIIARFLQGIFGAALFPSGMAIVADAYSDDKRTQALGMYGALIGIGLAFGPVIGGLITASLGWRWIFFINFPVVCVSLLICLLSVSESKDPKATSVDYLGMVLCVVFLIALIFAINEGPVFGWSSGIIIGCFVIALICGTSLVLVETRISEPLVDLHRFHDRHFLLSLLILLVTCSFAWSVIFLMPLYLQIVLNFHVATSGLMMLLMTGMTAAIPISSTYWYDKKSPMQIYQAGFITMIIALLLFCLFTITGPIALVVVSFLLCGFAWGVGNGIPIPMALSGKSSTHDAGIISGTLLTLMNTFAVILLPIITGVFRFFEQQTFRRLLNNSSLTLNAQQIKHVKMMASDPEHMTSYLTGLSSSAVTTIIHLFKQSFVVGLHWAFGVMFVLGVVLWLVATVLSRGDVLTRLSPRGE